MHVEGDALRVGFAVVAEQVGGQDDPREGRAQSTPRGEGKLVQFLDDFPIE